LLSSADKQTTKTHVIKKVISPACLDWAS